MLHACAQEQPKRYSAEEEQLRRDIGEMLLVGFRGTTLSDSCHIVRDIRDYGIGGVILFEYDAPSHSRPRNISSKEQLKQLCSDLQHLSQETLLIGIDQEGGRVTRLKEQYGFPAFVSHEESARQGDRSVRRCARLTATTLRELGINLDFAPCVDVNINPQCPIIGKLGRSFSADAERVARCAALWTEELQGQGVIACLKHFPGHGSSEADTHLGLADVSESWKDSELTPYRMLIDSAAAHEEKSRQVEMIMTTHVFNAQIDSLYPATLSKKTLTGLLRDSLHFQGVIITDDLAMGAMVNDYGYEEIVLRTILAGADLLCLSNNGNEYNADIVPQTVELVYRYVKEGKISADRIRESARRIRALKKQYTEHR